jgi:DNA-binding NarL/FixJ family response regulator
MAPIRVLVVEDHILLRRRLAGILRQHPGFEIVGEARNRIEALGLAESLRPDAYLMSPASMFQPELAGASTRKETAGDPSESLTLREREILMVLSRGKSNKEIASRLSISDQTVKIHLKNILKKLQIHNRTQAALYAYRRGLAKDLPASSATE